MPIKTETANTLKLVMWDGTPCLLDDFYGELARPVPLPEWKNDNTLIRVHAEGRLLQGSSVAWDGAALLRYLLRQSQDVSSEQRLISGEVTIGDGYAGISLDADVPRKSIVLMRPFSIKDLVARSGPMRTAGFFDFRVNVFGQMLYIMDISLKFTPEYDKESGLFSLYRCEADITHAITESNPLETAADFGDSSSLSIEVFDSSSFEIPLDESRIGQWRPLFGIDAFGLPPAADHFRYPEITASFFYFDENGTAKQRSVIEFGLVP